jgi:hypothetical protein
MPGKDRARARASSSWTTSTPSNFANLARPLGTGLKKTLFNVISKSARPPRPRPSS